MPLPLNHVTRESLPRVASGQLALNGRSVDGRLLYLGGILCTGKNGNLSFSTGFRIVICRLHAGGGWYRLVNLYTEPAGMRPVAVRRQRKLTWNGLRLAR